MKPLINFTFFLKYLFPNISIFPPHQGSKKNEKTIINYRIYNHMFFID